MLTASPLSSAPDALSAAQHVSTSAQKCREASTRGAAFHHGRMEVKTVLTCAVPQIVLCRFEPLLPMMTSSLMPLYWLILPLALTPLPQLLLPGISSQINYLSQHLPLKAWGRERWGESCALNPRQIKAGADAYTLPRQRMCSGDREQPLKLQSPRPYHRGKWPLSQNIEAGAVQPDRSGFKSQFCHSLAGQSQWIKTLVGLHQLWEWK